MSDLLSLVESAVTAFILESVKARENKESIQHLASFAQGSIKPQLDIISHEIRGNSGYHHLTESFSVLHNALMNAKGVVLKRGKKRSIRKLPLDVLKGKAAKIEAEIMNAEKLMVQGMHSLTLALGIETFRHVSLRQDDMIDNDEDLDTKNANNLPWAIEEEDIVIERNKRGKPVPHTVLGSGGFGTVVRGLYKGKVEVAVKEPHDALLIHSDPNLVKAFFREATSLYSINHSNIIDFYGAVQLDSEGDPVYAIVTEVLNMTLEQYVLEHEITIKKRHSIVRDVVNGIAFLHSMGIIHRDLNPRNIMMDEEGVPKIIDFGLSKQKEDIQKTKNTTRLAGTESWMAPEKKNGKRSTPASDMYSFGLVGYFILTGKKPSMAITGDDIEHDLCNLCKINGDDIYPRFILQCIDKERTKRPASATLAMYFFREESFRRRKQGSNEIGQSVASQEASEDEIFVKPGPFDAKLEDGSATTCDVTQTNYVQVPSLPSENTVQASMNLERREAHLKQKVGDCVTKTKAEFGRGNKKVEKSSEKEMVNQESAAANAETFGAMDTAYKADSKVERKRKLLNILPKRMSSSPADTIVKLKQRLETLEKREEQLEQKAGQSLTKAKASFIKGDKKGAHYLMKQKKFFENEMDGMQDEKMSVETKIMNLQSVAANAETFGAIDTAYKADSKVDRKGKLLNNLPKRMSSSPAGTIVKLMLHLETLEKREEQLKRKAEQNLTKAKARSDKGDKKGALLLMKRKKLFENEIDDIQDEKMSVETKIMNLQMAVTNTELETVSNNLSEKNHIQKKMELDAFLSDIRLA